MKNKKLKRNDSEIFDLINKESSRQINNLELIASENYTSESVMKAQGSILTNKYAEGYPNKRYYGGCKFVDEIEEIAINRCKKIFKCDYANVQPHSGSQANAAVYGMFLKPGDKILGLSLEHGGHLTHGSSVNFSGKIYKSVFYRLNSKGSIDYDELKRIALRERPKMIVAGASAYSLKIEWDTISSIAKSIGAYFLADIAHYSGLIVANVYPSPVGYADFVTSTTHKTLRGPRGGIILSSNEYAKKLNSAIFPGTQGGPLVHIIAAKAVAFKEAMTASFVRYQKQVLKNADVLLKTLRSRGCNIVSDKTDCHMFLVDLTSKQITGKKAEETLDKANITVNKNTVPNDSESPFVTSGIRIGTPAITTRGFKEDDIIYVGNLIADVLDNSDDDRIVAKKRTEVINLCKEFPLFETSEKLNELERSESIESIL